MRSESLSLTAYLQKHSAQLCGCTGEFPVHQRCTSNRGLGAVCASHRGRHPIFHFKRGLNFLREKMIAWLPDCLRARGWGEVVEEDNRELKVDRRESIDKSLP